MVGSLIADPLEYICNLSLKQGVFPTELTNANVLPLYKSNDPFCLKKTTDQCPSYVYYERILKKSCLTAYWIFLRIKGFC